MTVYDLEPAAQQLATLISRVPDELLGEPTPCPAYTLGDLVDHVGGLSLAFTDAARKDFDDAEKHNRSGDASRLGDDWRTRISADVVALAKAWQDPAAWEGMTVAGPFEMPGAMAGLVALDEIVIHGWDVARASGQPFDCDDASLEGVHNFVLQFCGPDQDARDGLFGPTVDVPADAPLFDRVLGLTGRDPAWSPSA
jgi:uncharacterized protein (TIGR03086 family)